MWTRFSWGRMALAIPITAVACGGDGGGGMPTSPSPPAGGGASTSVTVAITVTAGRQSFNPNPVAMAAAGTVTWMNRDGAVHRIIANDGSFDTGDIAPGATSRAVTPSAAGANYHCSIHPTMVGAIGAAQGQPPPPCEGQYC